MPQLILAIEGKYDFVLNTNPFGSPKKQLTEEQKNKLEVQRTALAMAKLEAKRKQAEKMKGKR